VVSAAGAPGPGQPEPGFPLQPHAAWRAALLLLLLTVALVGLVKSQRAHAALSEVLAAAQAVMVGYPVLGPLLFVLLAALTAMLAFASIAVLLPLAVVTWGEPLSILLLWAGWLLGGVSTYVIGRLFGRRLFDWLAAGALLQRLEKHVGPATPFGLVLLIQLALPSEIPGYVLGLVGYSFGRYLLALGMVELLYTVAAVHLGASFIDRQAGTLLGIGIAVALGSVGAFYLLRRRL
jgi:uncharacterized membrane protein YdjX (TVP38/TMEM64 family)